MHPGIGDLSHLSDNEIESKIYDLSRNYHISQNPDVQQQIILILDTYKLELENRRMQQASKQSGPLDENSLDNLIKVS